MIFITGANGLIGSYMCRELLQHGHQIEALKRPDSNMSLVQDIANSITWVEGDVLDPYVLEKAIEGTDWVIHCAAFISYQSKEYDLMHKINVEGTANVVNACLNARQTNLLHVSSVAAVGKDSKHYLVDETVYTIDMEQATGYAKSKYLAELEVWRGMAEGLNAIVVSPSLVLGPGDWTKSSTKIFKYVWDHSRFYTKGLANLIDVRDLAETIIKLMEAKLFGERFIVSAGSISYKDLFDRIAASFEQKAPDIEAKGVLIHLAIYMDKLKAKFTGKPRTITDELEQVASNRYVFDSTKVKKQLDMTFRSTEETISWCCKEIIRNRQNLHQD